ncbi:MAG: T9SS type A sorting domain-containing protein [Bacteroidia bacterium]
MRKIYSLRKKIAFAAMAILISSAGFAQVTVNATGGVTTASYTTLRNAFNAINAGTHTGTIAIGISGNTTETAPCVLNASGAGSANYTAIGIAPTVDGVTISSATASGHGVIELNGADNVTIDGDNPGTGGTNRNLTIVNTAANTVSLTSCIRLATSTLITGCDNITIKNLNLNGSGTGRNTAAYTSEVTTWGIIASGRASTLSSTTAPSALVNATTLVPSGQTFINLIISNNNIQIASRGISINGSATTVAPSLMISNNIIGNPTIGAADQITGIGITAQGTSNGTISGNTVRVEGYIISSNTNRGINVGLISTAGVNAVIIEKNNVERVYNNNVTTHAAIGIDISGGNNHVIRNNFVGQCLNSQVAGNSTFVTSKGAAGIRILAGTGHQIYHNTVHLTGAIAGSSGKNIVAAFEITSTASTGLDVRNNIFSNQTTGGNPTLYNTVLVSIFLPSGGTSAMNLTLNNNTYYQGTLNRSGIAQIGTVAAAANFYLAGNFNPATIAPASNLRSYTKNLSATGTNDNASYASSNATPVISATDLHISFASSELPNIDQKGDPTVGLTTDIDGDPRPSASTTNPDIGADEFVVPTCFAASGGTITPSSYSSCVGQTISLNSVGATNALGITYQWKISSTPGGPYSNVSGGVGANTASYTTPALTLGTNYYVLQTTCSFGPLTGLSNEVTVTTNALPVVTVSGSSSFCAGGNVTLTATSPGAGTTQWYVNDSLIVGATSTTYVATSAGAFNMIKTNLAGCSDSASTGITVTVNPLPTVGTTASPASATVCAGSNVTLSGTGANTYVWTGGITDNIAFTPGSSITYTVTGTDGNGCTNTATQAITVNSLPTVGTSIAPASAAVCAGSNATLNGTGASTYVWTGGVTNNVAFTPVSSATYTVTGTDVNGCTNTATQAVTVNSLPVVGTAIAPASATVCAGSNVTLNGTGATSYTWTGSVTNNVAFAPALSATYTVTGTDINGCTNTATQVVTVNSLPNVTAMASPSTVCTGNPTTLMGMGATSYSWTGGITDNVSFTPALSATYTVTGTDVNGCTNTAMQSVTVNTLPVVGTSIAPASAAVCTGANVTLNGTGATSYTWTGSVTNNVAFTPALSATYTVTGTDINGCTNTATQSVTVNSLPNVTAMASPATVCAGGSTTLMGMGATSYSWTGGITDNVSFTPALSATYTVTGTDVNGCTNTATQAITVNSLPNVTAMASPSAVCAGGSTTLNGMGATSYSWTGGVNDNVAFTPVSSATYTVTGTDINGCTNTAMQSVTVNPLPTVSFSPFATPVCNNASAFALTGGSPAGGAYTGSFVSAGMFDPTAAGIGMYLITYTITDVNSCMNSDTASITVDLCSGIVSNDANADISVYPNPTNGMVNISIRNADFSEMKISIIDIQGKMVYNSFESAITSGYKKEISLTGIAKGVYYIKFTTANDVKVHKLIVQ